jgi:hypothetical protein
MSVDSGMFLPRLLTRFVPSFTGAYACEYFVQTPDRGAGVGPAGCGVGFVTGSGCQSREDENSSQLCPQGERPQVVLAQEDPVDQQLI